MDFLGIGVSEFLFILIIAMLVLGPRRLPEYAAKAGKWIRDLRGMSQGLLTEWQREISVAVRLDELQEARRELEEARNELMMAQSDIEKVHQETSAQAQQDFADVKENLTSELPINQRTISPHVSKSPAAESEADEEILAKSVSALPAEADQIPEQEAMALDGNVLPEGSVANMPSNGTNGSETLEEPSLSEVLVEAQPDEDEVNLQKEPNVSTVDSSDEGSNQSDVATLADPSTSTEA